MVYCPKCAWNAAGFFRGTPELYNPCDPGCCTALACPQCQTVYKIVETCIPPCTCHYHWCLGLQDGDKQ